MKKRRVLFAVMFLLSLLPAKGQELIVKSFMEKTNDLSASTYERKDANGNSCALVKVQLATAGAQFSPNVVGNVDYKVNEYWVYLPTINKHLEVKHPNFLTKDVIFANYGVKLEPKTTYSLVLAIPEGGTTQQIVTSQYLMFNVKPTDAIVEVNGEVWTNNDGVSRKFVPFGEYTYSVEANNYHSITGTVTVNDPNNRTVVDVNLKPAFGSVKILSTGTLDGAVVYIDNKNVGRVPYTGDNIPSGVHHLRLAKPMYKSLEQEITVKDGEVTELSPELSENFATVTLSVGNNARILVNDELKGDGSWTGKLEYGDYSVTTKKDGHRERTKVYSISAASDRQTIKLDAPTPIYGSLNVAVLPDDSEVYLDGKKVGTTPLFLQNVLIGGHKLEVKKDGYQTLANDITIKENETYGIDNSELVKGLMTITVNGVSFDMIEVGAGTFSMGATAEQGDDAGDNEKPTHQVTLTKNYYMGKTEVTQALWTAVMGNNPSALRDDNKPVESVSWNDCQKFIKKLNSLTGKNFRLPTEAEWEFAARGGSNSQHRKYSGSDNLNEVGWHTGNSGLHDVAAKHPNELGIYDMSGNVWEWCQDWYGEYSSNAQYDPAGPTRGVYRVYRGGSWVSDAWSCRSSNRGYGNPGRGGNSIGFRLCLSSETTSGHQTEQVSSPVKEQTSNQINNSHSIGTLTFTANGVSFDMIRVEAGTFTMGATAEQGSDAYDDEKPAHPVTITNDYYMGKTEVTQALWKAVMGNNPSDFKGDNKPVEQLSWNDCQEFIRKLNSLTGKAFRLPTEAEWEFAARGGNNSRHYKYSGSDNLHEVGWYPDNSSYTTHDVATKQPNELGIYDMSGNVWEWCQDRYGAYSSNAQYDPAGPMSGSNRVYRGGSCDYGARRCRSSYRYYDLPGNGDRDLGFRLCLSE